MSSSLWYVLPLIVSVSLVYAGTRYEEMPHILAHTLRTARWISVFMLIVLAILYGISQWLL